MNARKRSQREDNHIIQGKKRVFVCMCMYGVSSLMVLISLDTEGNFCYQRLNSTSLFVITFLLNFLFRGPKEATLPQEIDFGKFSVTDKR